MSARPSASKASTADAHPATRAGRRPCRRPSRRARTGRARAASTAMGALEAQGDRVDHRPRRPVTRGQQRVHVERDAAGGREVAAELGDRGLGERLRLEHRRRVVDGDPGQRVQRLVARGEHDRQRQVGDTIDHERQPAQRRAVQPVRVVDQAAPPGSGGGRRPVELVSGWRSPRRGKKSRDRPEQLLDAGERERRLELAAAGRQDRHGRQLARPGEQRRLADPGRPAHERAAAALQDAAQRFDLGIALEQKSQGRTPGGARLSARRGWGG